MILEQEKKIDFEPLTIDTSNSPDTYGVL